MRTILPFALACVLAGPALAGETWAVREGPEGKTQGTWTIEQTGAELTGSATMIGADGKPLKYRVSGRVEGTHFTLRRIAPSDGVECSYMGSIGKGGMSQKTFDVSGSAVCRGRAGIWSVRQLPRPPKK